MFPTTLHDDGPNVTMRNSWGNCSLSIGAATAKSPPTVAATRTYTTPSTAKTDMSKFLVRVTHIPYSDAVSYWLALVPKQLIGYQLAAGMHADWACGVQVGELQATQTAFSSSEERVVQQSTASRLSRCLGMSRPLKVNELRSLAFKYLNVVNNPEPLDAKLIFFITASHTLNKDLKWKSNEKFSSTCWYKGKFNPQFNWIFFSRSTFRPHKSSSRLTKLK